MMARKNPAAVALGRISTPKKAQAARENGKKGGRPKRLTIDDVPNTTCPVCGGKVQVLQGRMVYHFDVRARPKWCDATGAPTR